VNKGSPGIDQVSIQQFEEKLEDNLFKLWNRMSSGSYFPKPYKIVMIPKSNGRLRQLSIPTVEDRIAQMVAKLTIEPTIDPIFTRIPMDIDRINQRTLLWLQPGSDAGVILG
jgi:RNA-directed DNA polymerase